MEKFQEADKEVTAELNRERQAEVAQRAEAIAAVGSAMQSAGDSIQRQQMINAINRPNCNAFGYPGRYTANCTTY